MVCQVWQDCEGLSLWVSDLTSTIDAAPEENRGPAILPKNGKDQAAATLCKVPFVVPPSRAASRRVANVAGGVPALQS